MTAAVTGARGYRDYYANAVRIAISEQFQYRVSNYFYMIGLLAEPVIYLVVWSTIAEQQGGQVGGLTTGDFAAYYIVWTLVRNMNVVNVGAWDYRVRTGELSPMLLRPIHPFNWDLGYFAGHKFVVIVLWLPIAAVLSVLFKPTFDINLADVVAFALRDLGRIPLAFVHLCNRRHFGVLDDAHLANRPGRDDARVAFLRQARPAFVDAGLGAGPGRCAAVQMDVRLSD